MELKEIEQEQNFKIQDFQKLLEEYKNDIDEEKYNEYIDLLNSQEDLDIIKNKYLELRKLLQIDDKEVFNNFLSKTTTYTEVSYTVEYLINEFSNKKIQMPKFQRMYVWDKEKVAEFILSILRDIPIPKLYGYSSNENGKQIKLIIDGQQRLTSLLMYYYGVFPKFKVRKINYSENMNEIVKLCNYYYDAETYKRAALREENEEIRNKILEEIREAKNLLEKKYKLNVNEQFEVSIFDKENNKKTLNISYRGKESILKEEDRNKILEKELGFVLIKGSIPSEAVDIFRLYNSSGVPLTAQEIRNGIYYNNYLYQKINNYNSETGRISGSREVKNSSWNSLRANNSNAEDVKLLFKFLSYYHNVKDKLKNILVGQCAENILEDKIEDIINNYSDFISVQGGNTEFLEKEFKSLENFFKMKFGKEKSTGKKLKNYISIFIILKFFGFLNNDNTDYSQYSISSRILNYDLDENGLLSCERLKNIYLMLKEEISFLEREEEKNAESNR